MSAWFHSDAHSSQTFQMKSSRKNLNNQNWAFPLLIFFLLVLSGWSTRHFLNGHLLLGPHDSLKNTAAYLMITSLKNPLSTLSLSLSLFHSRLHLQFFLNSSGFIIIGWERTYNFHIFSRVRTSYRQSLSLFLSGCVTHTKSDWQVKRTLAAVMSQLTLACVNQKQ